MLRTVPCAINRAQRAVVLRHPNSFVAHLWRKRITRVEVDPETGLQSEVGGMPTLGGMEVIKADDEPDFEYAPLGEARVMFGVIEPSMEFNERGDGVAQGVVQDAQIECLCNEKDPAFFDAKKGDLVLVTPGLGIVWAYSVESMSSPTVIPGYIQNFTLQPRDDLHSLTPYLEGGVFELP